MLGAEDDAFHGMGREDIDVRCLGRGRPFVVELKSPMRRASMPQRPWTPSTRPQRGGGSDLPSPLQPQRGGPHQGHRGREILRDRFRLAPLSEKEHAKLVAPMDPTKEDVQERVDESGKADESDVVTVVHRPPSRFLNRNRKFLWSMRPPSKR